MLALNQFVAEKESIVILPGFKSPKITLLSGTFGPFLSGSPCEVPLWLAIFLRKQSKCKIIIPAWLSLESLQDLANREKQSSVYQQVHPHYVEIASLLLQHASEDFEDANRVRSLLEDIEHIRMEKVRQGLDRLQPNLVSLNLSDLSSLEIAQIKPFVTQSMRNLNRLSTALQGGSSLGGGSRTDTGPRMSLTEYSSSIRKGARKLTKYT